MTTIKSFIDVYGPRFFIESTDSTTDLQDIINDVIKFEFHEDEKHQDRLVLTINNKDLKYNDDPRFLEGLQFQVRWGYANDVSDLRTAIIARAIPKFPQKSVPTMELVAYDLRRNMNRKSNPKNWGSISSSQVARAIAARYNFNTDIEESNDARAQHRIQSATVTDLQYLMQLASKLNWDFYLSGTTLHFHHKRYDAAPTLEFNYYTDSLGTLLEFDPEVKLNKPPSVGASGASTKDGSTNSKEGTNSTQLGLFDISTQQNNTFQASFIGSTNSGSTIVNPSSEGDKKVINLHADAAKQRIDMNAVKARAVFVGSPRLLKGSIVKLNGLGRVYSGNWRIASLRHIIEPKGSVYVIHAELSRNGINLGKTKAADANNKNSQDKEASPNIVVVTQTGNRFQAGFAQ